MANDHLNSYKWAKNWFKYKSGLVLVKFEPVMKNDDYGEGRKLLYICDREYFQIGKLERAEAERKEEVQEKRQQNGGMS